MLFHGILEIELRGNLVGVARVSVQHEHDLVDFPVRRRIVLRRPHPYGKADPRDRPPEFRLVGAVRILRELDLPPRVSVMARQFGIAGFGPGNRPADRRRRALSIGFHEEKARHVAPTCGIPERPVHLNARHADGAHDGGHHGGRGLRSNLASGLAPDEPYRSRRAGDRQYGKNYERKKLIWTEHLSPPFCLRPTSLRAPFARLAQPTEHARLP